MSNSQRPKVSSMRVSARQRSLLLEIIAFIRENGYPPTIRELCDVSGIPSTSVVNYHLNQLVGKGLISRESTAARGIRVTDAGRRSAGDMDPRDVLAAAAVAWRDGEVDDGALKAAVREYEEVSA